MGQFLQGIDVLVIEIELLTGQYTATSHDDRDRAEWPPHPARFFSALVAALHDKNPLDPVERDALLWLEQQAPPSIDVAIDDVENLGHRDVHDVAVPVNDITVIGDQWKYITALTTAQEECHAAKQLPASKDTTKVVKEAEKVRAKAERNLAKALAIPEKMTEVDEKAAKALLPDRRTRQMRTFPVFVPMRPVFAMAWQAFPETTMRNALNALCLRVTRLGHSSSLVRCLIVDKPFNATLVPSNAGDRVLRVVGPGQLQRLEQEFSRHQAVQSRVLPARPQRYSAPQSMQLEPPFATSIFSTDWIVYKRCGGARLRSSRGADMASALRASLLEANGTAPALPEALSGHRADGGTGETPHLAFIALPHVGHRYADGGVMGCAIVPPRELSANDRRMLMRLIATWELQRGDDGVVELGGHGMPPVRLKRVDLSEQQALQPKRWCRRSTRFVTATPIALDRNPGNLHSREIDAVRKATIEAQRQVAAACGRIGLPAPVSVEIGFNPFVEGAQPASEFRMWPAKPGRLARVRIHACIEFDQAVQGPVLLGAGRHFGLGLCLPVSDFGGEE